MCGKGRIIVKLKQIIVQTKYYNLIVQIKNSLCLCKLLVWCDGLEQHSRWYLHSELAEMGVVWIYRLIISGRS